MSEASELVRAERERLEARVRAELMGARRDGPTLRERELRVGMVMAFADQYARALVEAEVSLRAGQAVAS